jgi:hypothetical protein
MNRLMLRPPTRSMVERHPADARGGALRHRYEVQSGPNEFPVSVRLAGSAHLVWSPRPR